MRTNEEENDGKHIQRIILTVPCSRHSAETGDPCWVLPSKLGYLRAICGRRARAGGANGDISQDPRTKFNKKEYNR